MLDQERHPFRRKSQPLIRCMAIVIVGKMCGGWCARCVIVWDIHRDARIFAKIINFFDKSGKDTEITISLSFRLSLSLSLSLPYFSFMYHFPLLAGSTSYHHFFRAAPFDPECAVASSMACYEQSLIQNDLKQFILTISQKIK